MSTLEQGISLFQSGAYEEAIAILSPIAEQGNAEAQSILGCIYQLSDFLFDIGNSIYWYQKASEQGHGLATNNLGTLYFVGKGVEQSKAKAKELYEKARAQGFLHSPILE